MSSSVAAALRENDHVVLGGDVDIHAMPGGWEEVKNVEKDAYVQELGRFSVMEYNKKNNKNLTFVHVIKAEVQVVAGKLYRLVIEVADLIKMRLFSEAIVLDIPWKSIWQLISFGDPNPFVPVIPPN